MSTHADSFQVGLTVTAVPDGFTADGKCRISLQVVPKVDPGSDELTVDIRCWPAKLSEIAADVRIAAGHLSFTGETPSVNGSYLNGAFCSDVPDTSGTFARDATALWRDVFSAGESSTDAGFVRLMNALRSPSADVREAANDGRGFEILDYAGSDLGMVIDTLSASAIATTLEQRLASRVAREAVSDNFTGTHGTARYRGEPIRPDVTWWRTMNRRWFTAAPSSRAERHDAAVALLQPDRGASSALLDSARRTTRLRAAIDHFKRERGDILAWRRPADVADAGDGSDAFRNEMSSFSRYWGLEGDARQVANDECQDLFDRAPARKFAGILSYPSLAKFFRLIVDVVVERAALEALLEQVPDIGRAYGAIAADFGGRLSDGRCADASHEWPRPSAASLHWTATVIGRSVAGESHYFGTCGENESKNKKPGRDDLFRDGIVNLAATLDGSTPRFHLTTLDEANSVQEFRQAAAEISRADREGLVPDEQVTRIPPLYPAGIKLTDRGIVERHTKLCSRKRLSATISFICDLLDGYRVDSAMTPKNSDAWRDTQRWRSLVARSVAYPSRVSAGFLTAVNDVLERDDGQVRSALASGTFEDDQDTVQRIALNRDVFVWKGESLGAPSLQHERPLHENDPNDRTVRVDGRVDLGIDFTFDLPQVQMVGGKKDSSRCLPPLREGRSYIIGARVCLMNGCGPRLQEAIARYVAFQDAVVLGKEPGVPLLFNRRTEIQAPDVLLPWNDRLVRARQPRIETPGENIDTLVVRSGAHETPTARRMLMPARVPFDAAEQGGVFDDAEAPRTDGAFTGAVRFCSSPVNGTFPVARDGSWVFLDGAPTATASCDGTPAGSTNTRSRGSVLVLDRTAPPPAEPFHPDPKGGLVCARFVRNGEPAADFGEMHSPASFWPSGKSADAVPMVLELRRPRTGPELTRRGEFANEPQARVEQRRGGSLRLPQISVVLNPAEEVELDLWPHCAPTQGDSHESLHQALDLLRNDGQVHRATVAAALDAPLAATYAARMNSMLALDDERRMTDAARGVLDGLLCLGPIPQLCNKRTVRLVHAVAKPLAAPSFKESTRLRPSDAQPTPELHAVVVTVRPDTSDGSSSPPGLKTWAEYAQAHAAIDPLDWPSEPNGSTAFFVGRVLLDRPSTVKLRCEATWAEYEPSGVRQDPETKLWSFMPRDVGTTRLFAVEHIDASDSFRLDALDLLREDGTVHPTPAAGYRGLSYAFPNGKARRLTVGLIGTSRFTDYFPPEPLDDERRSRPPGPGAYERSSESSVERWVPATFRPRSPDVDRVIPVFTWKTSSEFMAKTITWKRDAWLRIYLERDSWHSTGEGEQLAVAFGPVSNEAGQPLDLCDFEEEVKEFGQYVTRWGADPIHLSAPLEDLIPLDNFEGTTIPNLRLPFAFEPVVGDVFSGCGDTLPAGSLVTVTGDRFIQGATAKVNGVDARSVSVINSMMLQLVTDAEARCPLQVEVRNPDLRVSIKTFEPKLDPVEGLWYCDLHIAPGASYFPFVQLGLARYQPHCAPNLELSPPRAVWAQLPPRRDGSVTFHDNRDIVVEHHGVGYGASSAPGSNETTDVPLLNIRLLRASTPGRVSSDRDGSIAWTPVLDAHGLPVQKLRVPPIHKDGQVWWCERLRLPPCQPGMRFGLLLEEVELMEADPEPTQHPEKWHYVDGVLTVDTIPQERAPFFLHVVDLGE